MKTLEKEVGNIKISVDYRVELLGIIMWISNYHDKWKGSVQFDILENKFFIDKIVNNFSKYKDDLTIKQFEELTESGEFSFDAPFALFLELNEHFKADKLSDYVFKERLQSNEKVFEFIDGLEDFAKRINFENYYESNMKEYQKYIDGLSAPFEMYDVNKFFDDYYGYNNGKKIIITPIPFMVIHGFACIQSDAIYSLMSASSIAKKENLYDLRGYEEKFLTLPIHEISHGYVDVLTNQYHLLDENTDLFDDMIEEKDKQANLIDTIINEHIVRAITGRSILYMHNDCETYENYLKGQREGGYIYIDDVIESLEYYETSRDKYPSFDKFYPNIIANLQHKKEKNKNTKNK